MPQTKKAPSQRSSSSKSSRSKSKGATKPKSSGRASRAKAKPKSQAGKTQAAVKAPQASSNGAGSAESVKDAVKSGAQDAAMAVRKAKVPLAASAAAVAGVAGAVALSRNGKRRRVLGVSMPKHSPLNISRKGLPKVHMPKSDGMKGDARKVADALTDAARRADHFGQRVSQVAGSVQKVSETASDAAKKA